MELAPLKVCVEAALESFKEQDDYLLANDLSERCIASRLALHLQAYLPAYKVDVEYNRVGRPPKRLQLPPECANYRNPAGEALVVPDIIVHFRGPLGPNLLVLEVKKTSNPDGLECDRQRLHAFRSQLGYTYGALVECETRKRREPSIRIAEWVGDED